MNTTPLALSLFIARAESLDLSAVESALDSIGLRMESKSAALLDGSPSPENPAVIHSILRAHLGSLDDMRMKLIEMSRVDFPDVDFVLQSLAVARSPKKLWAFDMDSTLIRAEVIDEYGRELGIHAEIAAITDSAMRGEIDFNASFRKRVALLKNLAEVQALGIWERIPLTTGADVLFRELRAVGAKTALLSGGFTHIAEKVKARLGIDSVLCNSLTFTDGFCTGEVVPPIVNAEAKATELERLRVAYGFAIEETAAVGDGANDVPMLLSAGLGIAVHAKPKVIDAVGVSLRSPSLAPLRHLIRFPL